MKYKICVIGDHGELLLYRMAGLETFTPENEEALELMINRLAHKNYGVIYLTEKWAVRIPDTLQRYEKEFAPAIIPLPGSGENLGTGSQRLKAMVEMAIGINILQTGE